MRALALSAVLAVLSIGTAPARTESLADAIAGDYPYLDSLFRHLHANPELSMQEFKTSDRLARELKELGFSVTRNIGKTGLVGTLRNGDGPVLLIRADMDGLPVLERQASLTHRPYARSTWKASTCRSCTLAGTTCTSPRWSAWRGAWWN